jgi:hypothetical protein
MTTFGRKVTVFTLATAITAGISLSNDSIALTYNTSTTHSNTTVLHTQNAGTAAQNSALAVRLSVGAKNKRKAVITPKAASQQIVNDQQSVGTKKSAAPKSAAPKSAAVQKEKKKATTVQKGTSVQKGALVIQKETLAIQNETTSVQPSKKGNLGQEKKPQDKKNGKQDNSQRKYHSVTDLKKAPGPVNLPYQDFVNTEQQEKDEEEEEQRKEDQLKMAEQLLMDLKGIELVEEKIELVEGIEPVLVKQYRYKEYSNNTNKDSELPDSSAGKVYSSPTKPTTSATPSLPTNPFARIPILERGNKSTWEMHPDFDLSRPGHADYLQHSQNTRRSWAYSHARVPVHNRKELIRQTEKLEKVLDLNNAEGKKMAKFLEEGMGFVGTKVEVENVSEIGQEVDKNLFRYQLETKANMRKFIYTFGKDLHKEDVAFNERLAEYNRVLREQALETLKAEELKQEELNQEGVNQEDVNQEELLNQEDVNPGSQLGNQEDLNQDSSFGSAVRRVELDSQIHAGDLGKGDPAFLPPNTLTQFVSQNILDDSQFTKKGGNSKGEEEQINDSSAPHKSTKPKKGAKSSKKGVKSANAKTSNAKGVKSTAGGRNYSKKKDSSTNPFRAVVEISTKHNPFQEETINNSFWFFDNNGELCAQSRVLSIDVEHDGETRMADAFGMWMAKEADPRYVGKKNTEEERKTEDNKEGKKPEENEEENKPAIWRLETNEKTNELQLIPGVDDLNAVTSVKTFEVNTLKINPEEQYCSEDISGTEILRQAKWTASKLGYEYISLSDASYVPFLIENVKPVDDVHKDRFGGLKRKPLGTDNPGWVYTEEEKVRILGTIQIIPSSQYHTNSYYAL